MPLSRPAASAGVRTIPCFVGLRSRRRRTRTTRPKDNPMNLLIRSFALAATLFAAPACAQEVKAGDLVITQAWSRATPSGAKIAGGYLTIENKGAAPDRLMGGAGDVAARIEVHEMATK